MAKQPGMEDKFNFAEVGDNGATIQVGGDDVQIEVPQGALPEGNKEVVTMRLLDHSPPDVPVEEGEVQVSPAVKCTPSGLVFKQAVKLTIPHCGNFEQLINTDANFILCTSDKQGKISINIVLKQVYKMRLNYFWTSYSTMEVIQQVTNSNSRFKLFCGQDCDKANYPRNYQL